MGMCSVTTHKWSTKLYLVDKFTLFLWSHHMVCSSQIVAEMTIPLLKGRWFAGGTATTRGVNCSAKLQLLHWSYRATVPTGIQLLQSYRDTEELQLEHRSLVPGGSWRQQLWLREGLGVDWLNSVTRAAGATNIKKYKIEVQIQIQRKQIQILQIIQKNVYKGSK